MNIDKDELIQLTREYGGQWGINHTRRLLHLVSLIDENQCYDAEVVWTAAHMHDWGGYSKWAKKDVNHALASVQAAEPFLLKKGCPRVFIDHVLEVIALHHRGDPDKSIEAILLSDADALDFLGVVGVLRDFSKNPKDLRKAFESAQKRRDKVPQMIVLQKSREIAARRIQEMDELLERFAQDTYGIF